LDHIPLKGRSYIYIHTCIYVCIKNVEKRGYTPADSDGVGQSWQENSERKKGRVEGVRLSLSAVG
jgi:hypothetical protein